MIHAGAEPIHAGSTPSSTTGTASHAVPYKTYVYYVSLPTKEVIFKFFAAKEAQIVQLLQTPQKPRRRS